MEIQATEALGSNFSVIYLMHWQVADPCQWCPQCWSAGHVTLIHITGRWNEVDPVPSSFWQSCLQSPQGLGGPVGFSRATASWSGLWLLQAASRCGCPSPDRHHVTSQLESQMKFPGGLQLLWFTCLLFTYSFLFYFLIYFFSVSFLSLFTPASCLLWI